MLSNRQILIPQSILKYFCKNNDKEQPLGKTVQTYRPSDFNQQFLFPVQAIMTYKKVVFVINDLMLNMYFKLTINVSLNARIDCIYSHGVLKFLTSVFH